MTYYVCPQIIPWIKFQSKILRISLTVAKQFYSGDICVYQNISIKFVKLKQISIDFFVWRQKQYISNSQTLEDRYILGMQIIETFQAAILLCYDINFNVLLYSFVKISSKRLLLRSACSFQKIILYHHNYSTKEDIVSFL